MIFALQVALSKPVLVPILVQLGALVVGLTWWLAAKRHFLLPEVYTKRISETVSATLVRANVVVADGRIVLGVGATLPEKYSKVYAAGPVVEFFTFTVTMVPAWADAIIEVNRVAAPNSLANLINIPLILIITITLVLPRFGKHFNYKCLLDAEG